MISVKTKKKKRENESMSFVFDMKRFIMSPTLKYRKTLLLLELYRSFCRLFLHIIIVIDINSVKKNVDFSSNFEHTIEC